MSSLDWVTRRGFLLTGSAALLCRNGVSASPACVLTSEQEEGPYYINDEKLRADVTEGKPGVPLKLRVALVDSKSCAPLPNAAVDIWHCDASGVYSGFTAGNPDGRGGRGGRGFGPPPDGRGGGPGPGPGRGPMDASRFLRGVQLSDPKGMVEFSTLYPGWYSGRAIHIHLKAHIGSLTGHVAHTGQFFFPEDLTERIAKLDPYAKRLEIHRTTQAEDDVFTNQHGSQQMLSMDRMGKSDGDGFVATITVAVDPDANPQPVRMRGRGPR